MNLRALSIACLILTGASVAPGVQMQAAAQNVQAESAQCILAGRISGFGRWGPRLTHLQLLDEKAQQVLDESSEALATIKAVRVNAPTLLVSCSRDKSAVKSAPGDTVPAVSGDAQALIVKALSLVPVGIGGHWVELEIVVDPGRIVRVPAQSN